METNEVGGWIQMYTYLFKCDKELLDLNVMEMDDGLIHFFGQIEKLLAPFEMENDQSITRKVTIDWDESLLQGRGIKGFFAPYAAGILSIGWTDEHKINATKQNQVPVESFEDKVHNKEQAQTVLDSLVGYKSPAMKREQNRIVYKQEPLYNYPIPTTVDMSVAFERATNYVKEMAEQEKQDQTKANMLAKNIDRITNYYTELLAENNKRVNRKGLKEEKVKGINAKSEIIELERDKQLREIYNKYNGDVEVNVDNGALYFIPLLEFSVEIEFGANVRNEIFYYNPITKAFSCKRLVYQLNSNDIFLATRGVYGWKRRSTKI